MHRSRTNLDTLHRDACRRQMYSDDGEAPSAARMRLSASVNWDIQHHQNGSSTPKSPHSEQVCFSPSFQRRPLFSHGSVAALSSISSPGFVWLRLFSFYVSYPALSAPTFALFRCFKNHYVQHTQVQPTRPYKPRFPVCPLHHSSLAYPSHQPTNAYADSSPMPARGREPEHQGPPSRNPHNGGGGGGS